VARVPPTRRRQRGPPNSHAFARKNVRALRTCNARISRCRVLRCSYAGALSRRGRSRLQQRFRCALWLPPLPLRSPALPSARACGRAAASAAAGARVRHASQGARPTWRFFCRRVWPPHRGAALCQPGRHRGASGAGHGGDERKPAVHRGRAPPDAQGCCQPNLLSGRQEAAPRPLLPRRASHRAGHGAEVRAARATGGRRAASRPRGTLLLTARLPRPATSRRSTGDWLRLWR